MRSDEEIADEVLRRTLVEVKATRTRRRAVKGAVAGLLLLTPGIFLFQRPTAVVPTQAAVEVIRPLPPSEDEAIAVMVWKDGFAHLEWINLRDLGTVELQFSLDPVIAFADDGS